MAPSSRETVCGRRRAQPYAARCAGGLVQLPLPPLDPPRPPRSVVVVWGLVAVFGCDGVDWVVGAVVRGAVVVIDVGGLGAFFGWVDPHPVARSDAATAAGSAYATRRDMRRPLAPRFPDDLPRTDFPPLLQIERTELNSRQFESEAWVNIAGRVCRPMRTGCIAAQHIRPGVHIEIYRLGRVGVPRRRCGRTIGRSALFAATARPQVDESAAACRGYKSLATMFSIFRSARAVMVTNGLTLVLPGISEPSMT